MNAITVSGIHGDARRLRVAAAFLAAAERSAAGHLADASPMSSKIEKDDWNGGMHFAVSFTVSLSPAA